MSFSIKTLFGVTTAIAVALFLLVAAPTYVAVPLLVLLHTMLGGLLLACIVYGSGNLRAFAIGAMIPAGATVIALTWLLCIWFTAGPWETKDFDALLGYMQNWVFTIRVWSGAAWILCPLVGLVTLRVRKSLQAKPQPPTQTPRAD